ncbi:MAG: hypothetical protein NPINA01_04980 [Nitrospinaceae bacterium]|nr:MAG: hypothetical protein NPINA01_04980 [Nitrospinaceae bacterium]
MTPIKKIIPILTVVSFMISGVFTHALGQESPRVGEKSSCKNGEMKRSVEVQYFAPDRAVPCEVRYYKGPEAPGMGQVLWRAANEVGFCEKKLAVFVEDLSASGWDCEQASDDSSSDDLKDAQEEHLPPDLSSH